MSLGLYVHLPFCRVHCTYCPFVISTDIAQQDRYVDALMSEVGRKGRGERVESIYFGGGTPSRTSIENLRRLVASIREHFDVGHHAGVSMEANPAGITLS